MPLALAYILPRYAAPAAGTSARALVRAIVAARAAGTRRRGARSSSRSHGPWHPDTLLALVPLGLLWTVVAAALVWRYGLAADERTRVGVELRRGRPVAADI